MSIKYLPSKQTMFVEVRMSVFPWGRGSGLWAVGEIERGRM